MDKNKVNVPKIRFPEFTGDWQQRKLKQLANFAKGQGYSKNDLTDVGTPIILYGRLYTKYQSTISEVDTFAVPKSGSVYSTGEEVIVPASGETAEDIARASAVVKSGFLLGGDLNIIYPSKDISTVFLALSISNGKQQKELSQKAQGKSVVHLHNSDLEDVTISFPCIEEQERIGRVFSHLDNLIIIHQRKLEHLKDKKKGLLQKMFPKEGEKFPELRFPGFTEPWKQCKFGEVIDYIVDNRGKNPKYYCESGIPVIDNYMIKNTLYPDLTDANRFLDENIYENFIRKYNKVDDILITLVGNGIGNITLFPADKAVIIQNTLGLRTSENKRFIFFLLMSKNREIITLDRGMAQPSIRQDEVLDIEIQIPNLKEQDMIGACFSNLDNLITLHQRKLEHLQQQKKGLLQQMFI